jgi:hypothetical protein
MTNEEIDRFAFVLMECERIRKMMVRDEAALSSGEHNGIPIAPAPPEQRPQTVSGSRSVLRPSGLRLGPGTTPGLGSGSEKLAV